MTNKEQLQHYVRMAHTLAEAVHKDVVKDRKISDNTVEALNNYIILYNELQDAEVDGLESSNKLLN